MSKLDTTKHVLLWPVLDSLLNEPSEETLLDAARQLDFFLVFRSEPWSKLDTCLPSARFGQISCSNSFQHFGSVSSCLQKREGLGRSGQVWVLVPIRLSECCEDTLWFVIELAGFSLVLREGREGLRLEITRYKLSEL